MNDSGSEGIRKDKTTAIAILDLENTFISARNSNRYLRLDDLDDWIHWHYNITEKLAFLSVCRSDGTRARLIRSGWTIVDSIAEEGEESRIDFSGNGKLNLEIALAVYDSYNESHPSNVIIISGNGEFIPIMKRIRRNGCFIEILSFRDSLSKRLARFADRIQDIEDILDFSGSQTTRLEKLISYTFETEDRGQAPDCDLTIPLPNRQTSYRASLRSSGDCRREEVSR